MSEASAGTDEGLESLVAHVADDFLDRLDRGERPEIGDYEARYPQLANVLPQVLPALRMMRTLSHSVAGPIAAAVPPPTITGELGDFRLLREIGRGGMGVVYEAEQISLGRRVALKVLPFASTLDAKQLQRFKNEAQAAAQLHHSNIVPVFAVGCERGVHYYAMQFIDGQTLAALIANLRKSAGLETDWPGSAGPSLPKTSIASGNEPHSEAEPEETSFTLSSAQARQIADATAPSTSAMSLVTDHSSRRHSYFRTAAALGKQAAEALEHAHQLGVVHRDVKPANLLVDGRGTLWVADFGLSRGQRDGGLTLSGDVLGTLRYMSPEQALGQKGLVDHRTDVYSLGATLYELLTLHPVWEGTDRRELLRQIAWEEPRPPARLNKEIPTELETIVLKALAKEPSERYASAQEFGDDLQRFLEDRPVLAQRPTHVQRLKKWVRRHRSVVWLLTILMVTALAGSVAATILIWREEQRITAAYVSEASQRKRAEDNLHLALEAMDKVYLKVIEDESPRDPRREAEYRELLENALHVYEQFAQYNTTEPELRKETSRAYLRVGAIQQKLGRHQEAENSFRHANALLAALVFQYPDDPAHRRDLARSRHALAALLYTTGHLADAEEENRLALDYRQRLVNEAPGDLGARFELAASYRALGRVLAQRNRGRDAEQAYRKAIELYGKPVEIAATADCRPGLAATHTFLGTLMLSQLRHHEAEDAFAEALRIYEQLATGPAAPPAHRQELAAAENNLGVLFMQMNRLSEAEKAHTRTLHLRKQLVADFPLVPEFRQDLAACLINLAGVWKMTNRIQKAEKSYSDARDLLQTLVQSYPELPRNRYMLAKTYCGLAMLQQDDRRPEEAVESFGAAATIYKKLVADFPAVDEYKQNLGGTIYNMAILQRDPIKMAQARSELEQLIGHDGLLTVERSCQSAQVRNDLAWMLATCPDERFRDPVQALALAKGAADQAPEVGHVWNTLGVAQYRNGAWKEAVAAIEKSMQLRQGGDAVDWLVLAMAHWRLGEKDEAKVWFERARTWMERNPSTDDEVRRFGAEAEELLGVRIIAPAEAAPPEWQSRARIKGT
jgi:serine/threonine protein kinase/Flp pilus assembly protein TadD